jgi:PKD repeat protein
VYDLSILDCDIVDNNGDGIGLGDCKRAFVSRNLIDKNNYQLNVYWTTFSRFYKNNLTNGNCGFRDYYGKFNHFTNNNINGNSDGMRLEGTIDYIYDNDLKNNWNRGIEFERCEDVYVENVTITGSLRSIYIYYYSDVTIYNSSLGNSEIYLRDFSVLTLVNSTFNKDKVTFNDETNTLVVRWYIKITIMTNSNLPIQGARVVVRDGNKHTVYNQTSDSNGVCDSIACSEYVENYTKRIYFTPHNITCTNSMGVGYAHPTPVIDKYMSIVVIIKDIVKPVANAGPDQTINQHEEVKFDGSLSTDNVGIINWTWTFEIPAGFIVLFGKNPSYVFHDAGVFTVELKVSDGPNWDYDDMNVTVLDRTNPVADAGPDIHIRQYETANFDGSESQDNVEVTNYTWRFEYNGSTEYMDGPTPEFTFDLAGEFNVTMIASDALNNWASDQVIVYVTDMESPIANAGADKTIKQHATAYFDGTGSSDNIGITTWTWTFTYDDRKITLDGPEPSYTFVTVGSYTVTFRVTDATDNWAEDTMVITVRDITPPVANAGDDITINQRTSVSFDGRKSTDNVAVVNWTWSFVYGGDTVILYGPEPRFRFNDVGEYEVKLKVYDDEGNWAEDSIIIKVNDITQPKANAGGNITVEVNKLVTFDGTKSFDDVDIVNWTWTLKVGEEEIELYGPNPSYTFTEAGNYTIVLKVTDSSNNWAVDMIWVKVEGPQVADDEYEFSDEDDKEGGLSGMAIAIIIAVVAIIIVVITLYFFILKKKKDEPGEDEGSGEETAATPAPLVTPGQVPVPVAQPQMVPPSQAVQPALPPGMPRVQPQVPLQHQQPIQPPEPAVTYVMEQKVIKSAEVVPDEEAGEERGSEDKTDDTVDDERDPGVPVAGDTRPIDNDEE